MMATLVPIAKQVGVDKYFEIMYGLQDEITS